MRVIQIILVLTFGLTISTAAQNVLIVKSSFARPGDTITVSADITNTDKFISFQFDLPLPDQVSFLGYSIRMSERSTNHVAIGNLVGANILRVFSYSPNNSAFLGNNGEVVSFKLVVGNIRGEFPLNVENGIIGDSLSQNIITGNENGILSVFPLGLKEPTSNKSTIINGLTIFPNPVNASTILKFNLLSTSDLSLSITNADGREFYISSLGKFIQGKHQIDISKVMQGLKSRGIYYLKLFSPHVLNPSVIQFILRDEY